MLVNNNNNNKLVLGESQMVAEDSNGDQVSRSEGGKAKGRSSSLGKAKGLPEIEEGERTVNDRGRQRDGQRSGKTKGLSEIEEDEGTVGDRKAKGR